MTRTLAVPVAALALLLAACASRPPEPTADTSTPRANAGSATAGGSTAAPATGNTANGTNLNGAAANASSPRERAVYFEFDSTTLSPQAQQVIQDNARYEQAQRARLRLEGNTDERGSREYNLALGQRRADAVRQAMQLDGVSANQIETTSYGEERPRCTDATEACYAQNRRVDIVAP